MHIALVHECQKRPGPAQPALRTTAAARGGLKSNRIGGRSGALST